MKEKISNQVKFKQTCLLFIRERQQNYFVIMSMIQHWAKITFSESINSKVDLKNLTKREFLF